MVIIFVEIFSVPELFSILQTFYNENSLKLLFKKKKIAKPRLNYGNDSVQAVRLRWNSFRRTALDDYMTTLERNISNLLVLILICCFHFHYLLI